MGRCRIPTFQQLIEKKIIYGPKLEPVWVYIEKEMRINISRKPYNEKVGKWLKFLRDLRYHYYCEKKRQLRILLSEVGPPWYVELATFQKEILGYLSSYIKKDLFGEHPFRTRKALYTLGVTCHIPKKVLLNAMATCFEDTGIFIWNLYSAIYKQSPSELKGEYDISAMILMSSLVNIDLKECIECLEKLTGVNKKRISIRDTNKKTRYYEPAGKFGVYLQRMYVPLYSNYPPEGQPKRGPPPLECKIKMRSEELELRIKRSRKNAWPERICNYNFWKPHNSQRGGKLLTLTAKATHIGPYENVQCCVGPVSLVGARPRYVINGVCYLPSRYLAINGGLVCLQNGEMCLHVAGFWIKDRETIENCESTCNCLEKWESTIMKYVREQRCMCKHLYDYNWTGKAPETYFYPPTRQRQYYLDKAKIYQEDPMEDFIKNTVEGAVKSAETTSTPTLSIKAAGLKESELLSSFLADLSNTPLFIPHLPQANQLNNLKEWVRRRVKGRVDPELHKQMQVRSMRRWLWLKHMDFKMRAYRIPFTPKQRRNLNWTHRPRRLDKLFKILLNNFMIRNRLRQLEQTRLWWPTMMYDMYPAPSAFRDVFFSYMPARMTDTLIINPYNSVMTPKYGAKTCDLDIFLPDS